MDKTYQTLEKLELHNRVEEGVKTFETTEFRAERFFQQVNALSQQMYNINYADTTPAQKTVVKSAYVNYGGDLF